MIEVEYLEFMLDDQPIKLRALGSADSRIWRALIKTQVGFLADVLTGNSDALEALQLEGLRDIASVEITAMIPILRAAFDQVNDTYDIAPQIVQNYAPAAISAELLDQATNAQVMAALAEMIRVEFASPFQMIGGNRGQPGPAQDLKSSSLPAQNGASLSESSTESAPTS